MVDLLCAPPLRQKKVFKKGVRRRSFGFQTKLKPGSKQNQENVSSIQHLLCFRHIGMKQKEHLIRAFEKIIDETLK